MLKYAANDHNVFVELTDLEFEEAWEFGSKLYDFSQNRGLHDYRTFERDGVDGRRAQQLGAVAECAVAKALEIPWKRGVDTFKASDLELNIEVRLIGKPHYGLRVYDRDPDSRRVVGLAMMRGGERDPYRLPGWINALYGKRPEFRRDFLSRGHPVYAVPQERLFSLEALKLLIQGQPV